MKLRARSLAIAGPRTRQHRTGGGKDRHREPGEKTRAPCRRERIGGPIERERDSADDLIDQHSRAGAQQASEHGAEGAAPITESDTECRTRRSADDRPIASMDHDRQHQVIAIRIVHSEIDRQEHAGHDGTSGTPEDRSGDRRNRGRSLADPGAAARQAEVTKPRTAPSDP